MSTSVRQRGLHPVDLACVTYISGPTGQPNGAAAATGAIGMARTAHAAWAWAASARTDIKPLSLWRHTEQADG
jgi:acyl-coenzyme A synthetase/AMP-(fatty) acid ligase